MQQNRKIYNSRNIWIFVYFVAQSTTNIRRLPSIWMFLFCCSIVVVYYRHLCVYVFITINGPKPEKGLFSVMSQNIALLSLFVNSAESSLLQYTTSYFSIQIIILFEPQHIRYCIIVGNSFFKFYYGKRKRTFCVTSF